MIKIEVFYKDIDQAPEYFEVEGSNSYGIEDGCLFIATCMSPYKATVVPILNIMSIEVEEVEDDV